MPDLPRNHFELFHLPVAYGLDVQALEQAYRNVLAEVHPDCFVHAGDAEQRLAMQWATRVNEAYQTLRKPFERARYLLELNGVQALDPKNTAMPPDFLMQQMDWREQLADARGREDWHALDRLERDMRAMAQRLERELAILLDDKQDYDQAAEVLRKYRFMEKLLHEVDDAYTEMSP